MHVVEWTSADHSPMNSFTVPGEARFGFPNNTGMPCRYPGFPDRSLQGFDGRVA
jgi:hypothetical protein